MSHSPSILYGPRSSVADAVRRGEEAVERYYGQPEPAPSAVSRDAFLGCDPGASGAFAIIAGPCVETCKMDQTERDIADWLAVRAPFVKMALLERVNAMPKQGVSSTFKFGTSYGFIRGLLVALRIPFQEVAPGVWQRAMGCLSHGDKNVTKAKAQQLYPEMKITHATADAILLATYARGKSGEAAPC